MYRSVFKTVVGLRLCASARILSTNLKYLKNHQITLQVPEQTLLLVKWFYVSFLLGPLVVVKKVSR